MRKRPLPATLRFFRIARISSAPATARVAEIKRLTVDSSLRFADTFPEHEQAAVVLGAAADDLYEMKDLPLAIESAHKLITRYPDADTLLRALGLGRGRQLID